MEVQRFDHEFGLEIFFIYPAINNLEKKFWVKKTVCGQLFTTRNRFGNVLKSDLWPPFRQ